jgi:diaminohydroxyphosphoribosylaminopyrimidine deaminase/5-amino-6-(5-phosphoribosylamino)uracil reductase
MEINDEFYMNLAIDEAWKYQLLTLPNPAVGCVIVKEGKILAIEAHKCAGYAHAEVEAIRSAFLSQNPNSPLKDIQDSLEIHKYIAKHHDGFFNDCEFFVTLEPCNHYGKTPACAILLEIVQPKRVVIASLDSNKQAAGGYERLEKNSISLKVGVCEERAKELLFPFIKNMNAGLKVFKYASRLDGSIDGGYISSQQSLEFVHKIRQKIDLLVIGGNTVRIDRPTLDTRFAKCNKNDESKNRAPDVLIYSSQKEFDQNIPLFSVPDRKVTISSRLLCKDKYTLVEGGHQLLEKLKDKMDLFLIILTPKYSSQFSQTIQSDLNLKILHTRKLDSDILIWAIKE